MAEQTPSRKSSIDRINELAIALGDGLSVEIDYDAVAGLWTVEIDQGLGYTPRTIFESGPRCDVVLDRALGEAGV